MIRAAKLLSAVLVGLALSLMSPTTARAEYPDRLVTIVVPYAAGDTINILARMFANRMGSLKSGTFIIENRPGAGTSIGAIYTARQPADG